MGCHKTLWACWTSREDVQVLFFDGLFTVMLCALGCNWMIQWYVITFSDSCSKNTDGCLDGHVSQDIWPLLISLLDSYRRWLEVAVILCLFDDNPANLCIPSATSYWLNSARVSAHYWWWRWVGVGQGRPNLSSRLMFLSLPRWKLCTIWPLHSVEIERLDCSMHNNSGWWFCFTVQCTGSYSE